MRFLKPSTRRLRLSDCFRQAPVVTLFIKDTPTDRKRAGNIQDALGVLGGLRRLLQQAMVFPRGTCLSLQARVAASCTWLLINCSTRGHDTFEPKGLGSVISASWSTERGGWKVTRPTFDTCLTHELSKVIFTLLCCIFHEIKQCAHWDSTEDSNN